MLLAQTDQPSAVLLVDELMAIGLYQKMADAGLRVGNDLAVVGFRDSPRSQHLSPSLARYRTLARDLAVWLGKVLLAEMSGRDPASEAVGEIWPMDPIVGESGGWVTTLAATAVSRAPRRLRRSKNAFGSAGGRQPGPLGPGRGVSISRSAIARRAS